MNQIAKLLFFLILLSGGSCKENIYLQGRVFNIKNDLATAQNIFSFDIEIIDTTKLYSIIAQTESYANTDSLLLAMTIISNNTSIAKDTFCLYTKQEINRSLSSKLHKRESIIIDSLRFDSAGIMTFCFSPVHQANISAIGLFVKEIQ